MIREVRPRARSRQSYPLLAKKRSCDGVGKQISKEMAFEQRPKGSEDTYKSNGDLEMSLQAGGAAGLEEEVSLA